MKILGLRLPSRTVALPLQNLRQVVLLPHLLSVPEQPSWLLGFLRWNQGLVPVLDLSILWQEPAVDLQLYTPVAVIEAGDLTVGLVGCSTTAVLEVDPSLLQPLKNKDSLQGWAAGMLDFGGENLSLLVPNLVLRKEEGARLAHWSARLSERGGFKGEASSPPLDIERGGRDGV